MTRASNKRAVAIPLTRVQFLADMIFATSMTVMVLNFDMPGDSEINSESDLLGYNVYRSEASGGGYSLISQPVDSDFLDSAVTNETTYYYVVTALDIASPTGVRQDGGMELQAALSDCEITR